MQLPSQKIARVRYRLRRRQLPAGFRAELSFWEHYLRQRGEPWSWDWAQRMDPEAPVGERLIESRLASVAEDEVVILDVGSGPTSSLGKTFPGKRIRVIGVDPLAREYGLLLRSLGLRAPAPVRAGRAEELDELFPPASFHFVYCRNALDHGADPERALLAMGSLLRPEGFLVLRHFRDEGAREDYADLHQWNLREHGDDLLVWRNGEEFSVRAVLGDQMELEELDTEYGQVHAVLRRRG